MSFDLFMMCVRDGETATFTRKLFEEIMSRDAIDPELPMRDVTYPDGSGSHICGADRDVMDGVSFNRPGGYTFYDHLWELADRTNSFFTWPDTGRSIAVTRSDMIAHLYEGAAESFGPPYVARTGKELAHAIHLGEDSV